MGRHDGEEYEVVSPCSPSKHQFAMNGHCHVCRWSRTELINMAVRTLELLAPQRLKS